MRYGKRKYKELQKQNVAIQYLHKFTDIVLEEYAFNPGAISKSVIDNIAISIVNEYLSQKENHEG